MVVIIEDVTDQMEKDQETNVEVEPCTTSEAAHEGSAEQEDSGSWVEVNKENSGNSGEHLEGDDKDEEEQTVDPEVFAVRNGVFLSMMQFSMSIVESA